MFSRETLQDSRVVGHQKSGRAPDLGALVRAASERPATTKNSGVPSGSCSRKVCISYTDSKEKLERLVRFESSLLGKLIRPRRIRGGDAGRAGGHLLRLGPSQKSRPSPHLERVKKARLRCAPAHRSRGFVRGQFLTEYSGKPLILSAPRI